MRAGVHPVLEVSIIALFSVVVSFLSPYTRMGGTELVGMLLAECTEENRLDGLCVRPGGNFLVVCGQIAIALALKFVMTVVTFGIKLPAGIFIPAL